MEKEIIHRSDCAVYNEPAYPAGPCDCGGLSKNKDNTELLDALLSLLAMCTINISPMRLTNSDLDSIRKAREIIDKYSTQN